MGQLTSAALSVCSKLYKNDHRHPCKLANDNSSYYYERDTGHTPLFLAACCGHADAVKVLLDHGASTWCLGGTMTPAHVAAAHGNVACMQAFIRPGFNINATGFEESTILHHAITGGVDMMKYILQLDGGKNLVNAKTYRGFTPLHKLATLAVDCHCQKLGTELLLQHGANISALDYIGFTPAHYFASWGTFECLQVLIDAGFDLQTRAKNGQTILHSAIDGGEQIVVNLRGLEAGRLIIDVEDNCGRTALDHDVIYHKKKIEDVLLRHHARRRPRK